MEFNPNYAPVSPSYTGQQYYWGKLHNRQQRSFLNERQNFFYKPQVNLTWFSQINDQTKLASVLYYSGGRGGGSSTLDLGSGSRAFARYDNSDPLYGSNIDWDGTIASNAGSLDARGGSKTAGQSLDILRNSVNTQDQFGLISKLSYSMNESTDVTVGVDWRTAEIEHYREVRDLLGGDYFIGESYHYSEFDTVGRPLGLGEKVH
ncbi:MAG: hypothetical protein J6386_15615 [Candidatus Synoicihabitans palmerolidicus]|nr:hypothetical protein [Candidatus Synoicihabitans palmerolidicus]